jgi:membrane protease subunit (stomatin/prohibitin family)
VKTSNLTWSGRCLARGRDHDTHSVGVCRASPDFVENISDNEDVCNISHFFQSALSCFLFAIPTCITVEGGSETSILFV